MAVVFSPSNLAVFRSCPLRFYGQTVSKEIKWRDRPAMSRGVQVHSTLERALKTGNLDRDKLDAQVDVDYASRMVRYCRDMLAEGYTLSTEYALAVTASGKACGFWDDDVALRCRADVCISPGKAGGKVVLGDWKTGKCWDTEDFQLRVEAVIAHLVFNVPRVEYSYWYVDEGESQDGVIDFSNGLRPVDDVFDIIRTAKLAVKNNYFPAVRNWSCRFCAFKNTARCNVG